jgi:HD superfamily phosphohydrolase
VIHLVKKYKFIRDSVYGDINLNEFEVKVMDMPQFQRIRRIKQLGLISLIYPGANHSRFEHCVGTMNLASKLATKLNLSKDEIELVRMSGLLHDIGHGPFSHVSEGVLSFPHEELTKYVIEQTSMHDLLDERFNTKDIADIINGKGELGPIISGVLDVDRMDYLLRDSHNTGVDYGVIDYERIISNLTLEDGLVLDIKGVQAAEGALVSRYFMYPSVYQHHTTRIVNTMFRRALKREINSGKINENDMYKYDDSDIISLFRQSDDEIVRDMINRLDNRIIPKRVKTIRLDNFKNPEKLYKINQKTLRKAEEEIAEDYNMDKNYVFINIAEYPRFSEMKTQVSVDNKLYPLTEISNIIGALSKARFNIPDISVYVPIEEKERFGKLKLEHYLDLPEVDREKFHGIHYDQIKLF